MFLADMATFGEANKAYNPHMPPVNPPARACVQTGLPPDQPVLMAVLVPRNHSGMLQARYYPACTSTQFFSRLSHTRLNS